MIDIVGEYKLLENFKLLASQGKGQTIRAKFLNAIQIQPRQQHVPVETNPSKWYSNSEERTIKLRNSFGASASTLDDLDQKNMIMPNPVSEDIRIEMENKIINARKILKISHPTFYKIHEFVIHSIFISHSNTIGNRCCNAASSSDSIGVIFINANTDLSIYDILELLIHETTHTLIFIDELCNKQFDYNLLIDPEYFSQSAILKIKRPLDKVIHSIIVAAQVLLYRLKKSQGLYDTNSMHAHPKTSELLDQTNQAIFDVENMNQEKASAVMTDHVNSLVKMTKLSLDKAFKC